MILKGEANWCKLIQPGLTYDKSGKEWTIDIKPTPESLKEYQAEGYTSGYNAEKGIIKLKKPTTKRDGSALEAPKVVDEYGTEWDPNVAIGNGSTVQVILGTRKGDFNGKPWVKPTLQKVMVQELVPYGEDFEYASKETAAGSDDPTDDSWTTDEG